MRLVDNWRSVLKRAWSIRLLIIAGALSGIEALLSILNTTYIIEVPMWVHIVLALLTPPIIAAAFVARIVAQNTIKPKGQAE
jgi:hypothetical protein